MMFGDGSWTLHGRFPEEDYQSIIDTLQLKFCQLPWSVQDPLPNIVDLAMTYGHLLNIYIVCGSLEPGVPGMRLSMWLFSHYLMLLCQPRGGRTWHHTAVTIGVLWWHPKVKNHEYKLQCIKITLWAKPRWAIKGFWLNWVIWLVKNG